MPTPKERYEDTRNVLDEFKGMSEGAIKLALDERGTDLIVAMGQMQGDFNFSCVVRTANAMGCRKVFYVSPSRRWDRRGAVGTHHYTDVIWLKDWSELRDHTDGYEWVALENNVERSVDIGEFWWKRKTCLILGEEGQGIPLAVREMCDSIVTIPQLGSVRSMNAAVAAGMAMYSYNFIIKEH